MVVSKPILVFSLSLDQAEQQHTRMTNTQAHTLLLARTHTYMHIYVRMCINMKAYTHNQSTHTICKCFIRLNRKQMLSQVSNVFPDQ